MAYDKVVDSSVLDAGLKQIADAIREKGGTSGSLAFPAAMAEAIAAIEAGGGGGVSVVYGSFTPSSDVKYYTVTHGLGKIPVLLLCWVSDYVKAATYLSSATGARIDGLDYYNFSTYNTGTTMKTFYNYPGGAELEDFTQFPGGATSNQLAFCDANENTFMVGSNYSSFSDFKLKSGSTYIWVAVG